MDPSGPFDMQPLITEASIKSDSGSSFAFHLNNIHGHSNLKSMQPNCLLLIPYELQLCILEMLPTQSVLNLFLASPHFRRCAENLPRSFWESRLFFDVPWCADMVLSQIPHQQKGEVQFNQLLYLLRKASAVAGYDDPIEYLTVKNRRCIWINCERILRDIQSLSQAKK